MARRIFLSLCIAAFLAVRAEASAPHYVRQAEATPTPEPVTGRELGPLIPGVAFPPRFELPGMCAQGFMDCVAQVPDECMAGVYNPDCCGSQNCFFNAANACGGSVLETWNEEVRQQIQDFFEGQCTPPTPTPGTPTPVITPTPSADPSKTAAPSQTAGPSTTAEPTTTPVASGSAASETPTESSEPRSPPSTLPTVTPTGDVTADCADELNVCVSDAMTAASCTTFNENITECCDAFTMAEECIAGKFEDGGVCAGLESDPALVALMDDAMEKKEMACSPDDDDDDSVCFPGDALVTLENGAEKRMDQLQVGDRVLAGNGIFSDVFFFSHRVAARKFRFVELQLANKQSIALTSSHYLPVNGVLSPAGTVKVGDEVVSSAGQVVKVAAVGQVVKSGLYNPHTIAGDLVVNGVQTSAYTTSVHPALAHSLLAPLRALYKMGVVVPGFLDSDASTLAALMPKGQTAL